MKRNEKLYHARRHCAQKMQKRRSKDLFLAFEWAMNTAKKEGTEKAWFEAEKLLSNVSRILAQSVIKSLWKIGPRGMKPAEAEAKKAKKEEEGSVSFYAWLEKEARAIALEDSDIVSAVKASLFEELTRGKAYTRINRKRKTVIKGARVYYEVPREVIYGTKARTVVQEAMRAGRREVRDSKNHPVVCNGYSYLSLEYLLESGKEGYLRSKKYERLETEEDARTAENAQKIARNLKLTDKQSIVFEKIVCKGYGAKAIAKELNVTPEAVKDSKRYIKKKAGARIDALSEDREAKREEAEAREAKREAEERKEAEARAKKREEARREEAREEAKRAEARRREEAKKRAKKEAQKRRSAEAREKYRAEAWKKVEKKAEEARAEARAEEAKKREEARAFYEAKKAEEARAEEARIEAREAMKREAEEARAKKRAKAEAEARKRAEAIARLN